MARLFAAESCLCCSPKRDYFRHAGDSATVRRRLAVLSSQLDAAPFEVLALPPVPLKIHAVAGGSEASDGGSLVNTVLGPISSRQLGMVLPHEHCFVSSAGVGQVYPERVPLDYIIPEAVAALRQFRAAGGSTIVDCTTSDLGRNIHVMAHIAKESEVNIIATTGSWIDPPRAFHNMRAEDLAELWIREAMVGIEGTSIKAGILKCAHETGVTWEKGKGFTHVGKLTCRAVALAQKTTGLPITTHTEAEEEVGLAQIAIFEEEGVDLNRVYIGHCNDSEDLKYLTAMLHKGVWLGLDRTGPVSAPDSEQPDWEGRTLTIKRLIDAGWGHRIMLSHDWMVFLGFMPNKLAKKLRKLNPDGYTFILKNVIPRLHEMGISKEQTDAVLYDNPRRFFENVK